jgi:hypothetical protein
MMIAVMVMVFSLVLVQVVKNMSGNEVGVVYGREICIDFMTRLFIHQSQWNQI